MKYFWQQVLAGELYQKNNKKDLIQDETKEFKKLPLNLKILAQNLVTLKELRVKIFTIDVSDFPKAISLISKSKYLYLILYS